MEDSIKAKSSIETIFSKVDFQGNFGFSITIIILDYLWPKQNESSFNFCILKKNADQVTKASFCKQLM